MKNFIFLLVLLLFSCKNSTEENCFENGEKDNTNFPEFQVEQLNNITKANPDHVQLHENKMSESYDSIMNKVYDDAFADEKTWHLKQKKYKSEFSELIIAFKDQFIFKNIQKQNDIVFGLAENQFGYWLLEIKNTVPNAYFLGLSDYTYINNKQKEKFVKNDKIFLDGSFIRVSESWGYPFGPPMEVVKDQITFEIDLNEVLKDTDKDRFNDLFEKLILLNPQSKDTDQDGINDFIDVNPLYKKEQSKFSILYQQIMDLDYQNQDFSSLNYSFAGYFSDCEYFQKVNPTKAKVLIYPENKRDRLKNDYRLGKFTMYYGKIKKSKDANTFNIHYGSGSGGGNISAKFESGKWIINRKNEYSI